MPVVKKPKKGKKVRQPKKNRVATAPTRDVIINISTARPRASKTLKPAVPKRSEDLGGRIKDFEVSQAQFRQTQMIKEQAIKMGLIDKRLSVLTDVVDNERTKPLVQKGGDTPQIPKGGDTPTEEEKPPPSEEQLPSEEREEGQERIDVAMGKQRGRPKLSEEQKQANKEKRETARREGLTNPVIGTAVSPVEVEMTGKKEPAGGGGGRPRADLVGAKPLPKGVGSDIPFAEVEGVDVDRGAEEKPFKTTPKKKGGKKVLLKKEDASQTTLEGMFEMA